MSSALLIYKYLWMHPNNVVPRGHDVNTILISRKIFIFWLAWISRHMGLRKHKRSLYVLPERVLFKECYDHVYD